MLAGDQAAVLAESEESLQELVMRDAKARTDYRLRQNANDKGDGAGEAARCDHNADGEGKGWIGAGRPSEMDVGPGGGGQKAPRQRGVRGSRHTGEVRTRVHTITRGEGEGLAPGAVSACQPWGRGLRKVRPPPTGPGGLREDRKENTWVSALQTLPGC